MTKKRIDTVQIIVVCFLLGLGVLFILNAKPYRVELSEDFLNPSCFSFLQKGDYTMDITYSGAGEGCEILVYSDVTADSDNMQNAELGRMSIAAGDGRVEFPLKLSQGTYRVIVTAQYGDTETDCLTSLILQSDNIIHKDNFLLAAIFIAAACLLYFIFARVSYEKYKTHIFLLAVGLGACIPIMSHSLILGQNYDIQIHIARIEGIYKALAAGDFPVRVNPVQMQGYGSLSATMYPQLFLYPIALLRFLGISEMLCYKLMLVIINVATAYSSYYAVKNITKSEKTGAWMSVLYTFSMYRLCNVYVRGALGESLAMIFLPIVIWGCYELLWGSGRFIILALGMTGVLQSHVLSTEMCAVFLMFELVWWLVSRCGTKEKRSSDIGVVKRIWAGVKAVMLTLVLNAGFLIPFLYFTRQDLQCFNVAPGVANSAAYFSQMFAILPHADGVSKGDATTNAEMTISVGIILLLGLILFIISMYKFRRDESRDKVGIHCMSYGIIALILSSWIFPWDRLESIEAISGIVSSLQFVWRFLGLASVFLCIVTAIAIEKMVRESERFRWIYACMAVILIVSSGCMFDELAYRVQQETDPMTVESWTSSDHLYLYMGSEYLSYKRENAYIRTYSGENALYENYIKEGTNISVEVTPLGDTDDYLIFPLYHFPGYEVRINGEKADVMAIDTLVACRMPMEHSLIEISYKGRDFFIIGDIMTVISLLGMAVYFLKASFIKK